MTGQPDCPRSDQAWWEPLRLDRIWDTRWDAEQSEDAILRADEQALAAKANLERAIACVRRATEQYSDAMEWVGQARRFGAKFLPTIPDPPAPAQGQRRREDGAHA